MPDKRHKDSIWNVSNERGEVEIWEQVQVAVLMDLRDELKEIAHQMRKLNRVFQCPNFLEIPRVLRSIRTSTSRIPRVAKKC